MTSIQFSRRQVLKTTCGISIAGMAGCTQKTTSPELFSAVTNISDGTVSIIDHNSRSTTQTLEIGKQTAHGIGAHPTASRLYVSDNSLGQLYSLSTQTFEIEQSRNLGVNIHGIDVTPSGAMVIVSGYRSRESSNVSDNHDHDHDEHDDFSHVNDGVVMIIDPATLEIIETITMEGAGHTTFGADGHAFTTMYHLGERHIGMNKIAQINLESGSLESIFQIGDSVINSVALSTTDSRLYAASRMGNSITSFDFSTNEIHSEISTGSQTHDIEISPDGENIWSANRNSTDVRIFSKQTGELQTSIMGGNNHISFSPDGTEVHVTSTVENTIIIIDSDTFEILDEIPVGNQPHEFVFFESG